MEANIVNDAANNAQALMSSTDQSVPGQRKLVWTIVVALYARLHLLLQGPPGVAKTHAAKAVARALDIMFTRIQFNPDLMPLDITGSMVYNQKIQDFEFRPGPILRGNIILADEFNRARATTASALLEAMAEGQVTIDGETYWLQDPFLIIGTQNPLDSSGTFETADVNADRFGLCCEVNYLESLEDEVRVALGDFTDASRVKPAFDGGINCLKESQQLVEKVRRGIDRRLAAKVIQVIRSTRQLDELDVAAGHRASIDLMKAAAAVAVIDRRNSVEPEDFISVMPMVLTHRLQRKDAGNNQGIIDDLVTQLSK